MTQQPINLAATDFEDLDWTVGDRFRKAREARTDHTRLSFARVVGCSRDTIQAIEESTELPKQYFIDAYVKHTNTPEAYFVDAKWGGSDSNRRPRDYLSAHLSLVPQAA